VNGRRLGVFGGTFDPIHNGHLAIAQSIFNHLELDRILFVPSARPPHKKHQAVAPAYDRFRMAELALQPYPRLDVSKLEFNRPGLSYTVDTLKEIRKASEVPVSIYLILGADCLLEMETWHEPDQIFDLASVVVFPRSRMDFAGVKKRWLDQVITIPLQEFAVSSTDIRRQAGKGRSIADLVPKVVATYIAERNLYGAPEYRDG